jgi:RsmE family RNA methyltransferase
VNLLLLDPDERELAASDARARHICDVLRLGPGDTLRAGVIGGALYTCTIRSVSSQRVSVDLSEPAEPPPVAPVELLLGHPRPIVLKRMLRDLASLGISTIRVSATALGEKSYLSSGIWEEPERYLREGAAQGGFTTLPRLVRHHTLTDALAALVSNPDARLVLHPADPPTVRTVGGVPMSPRVGPVPQLSHALGALSSFPVCVAVGSERGWTLAELDMLEQHGFVRAHLGEAVLRTEVAAHVAVWGARERWERHRNAGSRPAPAGS